MAGEGRGLEGGLGRWLGVLFAYCVYVRDCMDAYVQVSVRTFLQKWVGVHTCTCVAMTVNM